MSRSSAVWPVIVVSHIVFAFSKAGAQSPAPPNPGTNPPPPTELRELRGLLEQQGKQIEALTQQITKLTLAVEGKKESAPPVAVATAIEPVVEVTKAPETLNKHVVEKGETLTSIAKHFNISITDLQKVNKIENERKLQIGQTLVIPSPKTPEQQSEKKENP
ncbi:MAG: Peptidoglycan-binding LysM [Chthoniobacteraceae bacterium]|nr:Peptidoglycan-binding LysM [Chthoniobacteraceae bacterium]